MVLSVSTGIFRQNATSQRARFDQPGVFAPAKYKGAKPPRAPHAGYGRVQLFGNAPATPVGMLNDFDYYGHQTPKGAEGAGLLPNSEPLGLPGG